MYAWLVTGASRGIGLEFVRQIALGGDTVFATARNPASSPELQALHAESLPGRVHVVQLDVTNAQSISDAARSIGALLEEQGLDYLVNNAAISPRSSDTPTSMNAQDLLDSLTTNVVGPALVYQAFLPALERSQRPEGPVVMNTTSGLASIGLDFGVKATSYSISKCALGMLTYKQSKETPNIIAFVLDPGWVKTAIGGPEAQMEIPDSVRKQYQIVKSATKRESGTFKLYNGDDIPW